jgi:hypothetical protein
MVEILKNFEKTAAEYDPAILIAVGIAATIIGLFVWLGGLGLRKVLLLIVGAAAGAALGYMFASGQILIILAAAVGGAFLATVVEKLFITLLSCLIAVSLVVVVFAQMQGSDIKTGLWELMSALPKHELAAVIAVGVVVLLGGLLMWRFTSALCYATLGAALVFAGMTSLLLYKGNGPITKMTLNPGYYGLVFVVMVAFGTVIQMLFCSVKAKKVEAKKAAEQKVVKKPSTTNWRGT